MLPCMSGPTWTFVRLRLAVLALLACLALGAGGFAPPPIDGHVTDPAHRLTMVESELESRLDTFDRLEGDEIAVLVVSSLDGATIEDAAYATFNAWKLGKKGADNGILLMIAPSERKIRIETGRGVGDRLPDAIASRIIREQIAPRMRVDDVGGAVARGLDGIEAALRGMPLPPPAPEASSPAASTPAPASSVPRESPPPRYAPKTDYPDWQRREDEAWMREYEQRKRDAVITPLILAGIAAAVLATIIIGVRIRSRRARGASDPWARETASYLRDHPEASSRSSSSTGSSFGGSSLGSSFGSGSSGSSSSGSSGDDFRGGGGSSGGGGASGSY